MGILALAGCGTQAAQPESGSSVPADSGQSVASQSSGPAPSQKAETDSPEAGQSSAPQSSAPESAAPASSGPAPSVESKNYDTGYEISTDGVWEAYDSNRDEYKLHVRKKDGTQDRVIVDDIVLCPCLAGDWVYYFNTLNEIDKVKLDGSGKTKVCGTEAFQNLNGSTAVTASYRDGYILYQTVQLREVGNNSSYPPYYYKLDVSKGTLTPVKG